MKRGLWVFPVVLMALGGCAVVPTSPNVTALPGAGRSFDEFRKDDADCRVFAHYQVGGSERQDAANAAAVQSAVAGTAIGALAGAAIGGHHGAGVGAGMGLLVGSATGADISRRAVYGSQRHFDSAYIQCMYARGHRVPLRGGYVHAGQVDGNMPSPPPPARSVLPPPPPPGGPPPPPPY